MFELKLKNNTIQLKWGTWAMKRFCELEGKTLMQMIGVLSSGEFDLKTIVSIVQSAAEAGCKTNKQPIEFGEFEVCEWIDEAGGLSSKDSQIVEFINYMQSSMNPDIKQEESDEKKN